MHTVPFHLPAFLLLVSVAQCAMADEPARLDPPKIVHGPYLDAPRPDSVTIIWFTDQKCVSRVEYGTANDLGETAKNTRFGLVDANTTRHVVRLDRLRPGTTYYYRVVSKEIVDFEAYRIAFSKEATSRISSFRTLDPVREKCSFCVVSDNHDHAKQLGRMLDRVDWTGLDFVVLNGDMVSHFDRESQLFDGFLDVCAEKFAARTPLVYVRGNHETRGPMARHLFDYVPTPEGRFYYSFDHGGVHFIVLDSGEDKSDDDTVYYGLTAFDNYRREQARWLEQEIAGEACRNARFRIALFHIPPKSDSKWHARRHIQELWTPLLNQGKIDLVICGHTHENAHIASGDDAHRFDLAMTSPTAVLRVDVAADRMSVKWDETDPKTKSPKTFDIVTMSRQRTRSPFRGELLSR